MAIQVKERTVTTKSAPRQRFNRPFGLGYAELIALVAVTLFCVSTLIYYLTSISPLRSDLSGLKTQLDGLKKTEDDLIARSKQKPEQQVDMGKAALASLEDFKSSRLKPLTIGRIALINDINALAKKHNVQLSSGIDMNMDRGEPQADTDQKGAKVKRTDKLLSVFPNLRLRFTVAGDYGKLRAFISELETNKQFITIDSLSLLAIRDTQGGEGRGRRRAATLSGIGLSIEMTAFFYPQYGK
jgi:hypothetical protein